MSGFGDGFAGGIASSVPGIIKELGRSKLDMQRLEMEAALRNAQTYQSNMAGNLNGAKAADAEFTLGRRRDMHATPNASAPAYQQFADRVFVNTGDTNAENVAKAAMIGQTIGIRDKASQSVGDLDMMNRLNTLAAPGQTYTPYDGLGTSGYAINKATGTADVANKGMALLFGNKINSEINENKASAGASGASAGLSNERRKEIQMGKVTPAMEGDNPVLIRAGTNGKVSVIDDFAPYKKAGGADAADTKLRGQIARDVQKDPSIYPEEQEAEIDRRVALATKGGKPAAKGAAPADGAPTMPAPPTSSLKEGVITKFKNGQSWTIKNGKPEKVG